VPEQYLYERERSKVFELIFQLLHNIEQDNLPLVISLGQDRQSRTAQNFFNKNKQFEVMNAPIQGYINTNPNKGKNALNEIVEFKAITIS
jgi:hypothetical protein